MVALYFSHLSLVGGSTIGMGIKKSTSPKCTMVEVCAMVRSFNVHLDLLIKSRSRSQFVGEIEQYKVVPL